MKATLRDAQLEAARCWNDVAAAPPGARGQGKWPRRDDLQKLTKSKYQLHSQTVQMIGHQLLANVEATAERRRNDPSCRRWLVPLQGQALLPALLAGAGGDYDPAAKRLILPMGRGRKSLVFKLDLDFVPGAAKLVWNDGYELHLVRTDLASAAEPPGPNRATVDLGEIHQAAVATPGRRWWSPAAASAATSGSCPSSWARSRGSARGA